MRLLYQLKSVGENPGDPTWLLRQSCPVIAIGTGKDSQADVIVPDEGAAAPLVTAIEQHPIAALVLVQVLRAVENLPVQQGMTVESLAYSLLQAGAEHRQWLESREQPPELISGKEGRPVTIHREGDVITARLNRPEYRNSLSVEMRDALIELFELVIADDTIERLELSGAGGCFSVGGELREFGLTPTPEEAHLIRSVHNPGRLLATIGESVHCHLHSACVGSGIELPAFAGSVSAAPGSFFQLPELKFGLIPGAGGCVSISRRIGRQRTAWLVLTGRRISVDTALEWGLVDAVVD